MPRGWLSTAWGADRLLEHLLIGVMRQPVADVGHYIEEYFVKIRRRRCEGMAEYCLRVHESYQRQRVALSRIKNATIDKKSPLRSTATWEWSRAWSADDRWGGDDFHDARDKEYTHEEEEYAEPENQESEDAQSAPASGWQGSTGRQGDSWSWTRRSRGPNG